VLTQRELLYLLRSLQQQHGFSILLISHDIPTAFKFCHRIAIVHEGTIIEQGPPDTILAKPQHPYTKQLLAECQMLTA
jgi:ABC-type dipeptide/oligopeptide/nickel transport system ATPase component